MIPSISDESNSVSSLEQSDARCNCEPKMMIVDDTAFNLFTLRININELFQLPVEEAENGQVAIDKFKAALDKPC